MLFRIRRSYVEEAADAEEAWSWVEERSEEMVSDDVGGWEDEVVERRALACRSRT